MNPEDDSTDYFNRLELLYPLDRDQTILLQDIVMEDSGIYHCESADGEKLSTLYITVEGRFGYLFDMLLCYCHVIWNY